MNIDIRKKAIDFAASCKIIDLQVDAGGDSASCDMAMFIPFVRGTRYHIYGMMPKSKDSQNPASFNFCRGGRDYFSKSDNKWIDPRKHKMNRADLDNYQPEDLLITAVREGMEELGFDGDLCKCVKVIFALGIHPFPSFQAGIPAKPIAVYAIEMQNKNDFPSQFEQGVVAKRWIAENEFGSQIASPEYSDINIRNFREDYEKIFLDKLKPRLEGYFKEKG